MRLSVSLALASMLLSAAVPATAVPVRGLYEASVAVRNQSAEARDPVLQQALQTVLVRVTGTRALPQAALDLLPRAASFVQGYGYESPGPGRDLRLRAQFDARAIEAALRAAGLSVWGANRPSHVAWIALRDDGQPRSVLDTASADSRAPALAATAEARGLPLVFPSFDATDRQMVNFNDLWSGQTAGAEGASRRYNATMVLIGRVGRESGQWIGHWTLLGGNGLSEEWTSLGASLDETLTAGINDLADRQARRYAVQAGSAREVLLQVYGVESLDDYGRVLNYVRGLSAVRGAQVDAVEPGAVTLRLRVEGDPESLSRAINAGRVMRPQEQGRFASTLAYDLVH